MSALNDRVLRGINMVGLGLGIPQTLWREFRHRTPSHQDTGDPVDLQRAQLVTQKAAEALGYPMPEVRICESDHENAWAHQLPRSTGVIEFSTALLHNASDDELLGVTAHEVAHLQNGDAGIHYASKTATFALSAAICGPILPHYAELLSKLHFASAFSLSVPAGLASVAAGGAVTTVAFVAHRAGELRADRAAARVVGPDAVISQIERTQDRGPLQTQDFGWGKTLNRIMTRVQRSHPDYDRRVEQMLHIKAELTERAEPVVEPVREQALPEPEPEPELKAPTVANVERSLPVRRPPPERGQTLGL